MAHNGQALLQGPNSLNVQPGTAAQLKKEVEVNNKKLHSIPSGPITVDCDMELIVIPSASYAQTPCSGNTCGELPKKLSLHFCCSTNINKNEQE